MITALAFSLALAVNPIEDRFVTPKVALTRLFEGNKRFVGGKALHAGTGIQRRSEVANGQKPFAVIIGCADSRVGPELVFDQGLGDLFVVRTAGNLVDTFNMASTEYAVEHLGARLIVVMGHEKCGAVKAALETYGTEHAAEQHSAAHDQHGVPHDHIGMLLEAIKPAILATKGSKNWFDDAIRDNVKRVAKKVRTGSGILTEMLHKGEIKVVGSYYDLDSGTVTFFDND
ncbi:MAG: carbonic anhydrase [Fimbriimonadaceae bacterium]|nr:carbonic anhydrase [Fimbriimonadaceae bacterium]